MDANESDEKGLAITDNWMSADTTQAVTDIVKQMKAHPGFNKMKARHQTPKVFIAEVQNQTSEAYFPIGDLNWLILPLWKKSPKLKDLDI